MLELDIGEDAMKWSLGVSYDQTWRSLENAVSCLKVREKREAKITLQAKITLFTVHEYLAIFPQDFN